MSVFKIRDLFKSLFLFILLSSVFAVQGLQAQPIESTPEYQAAKQFLAQGAYDSAASEIEKLIANRKFYAPAMVELGRIRLQQAEREMSMAMTHFSEAANSMKAGLQADGASGPELPKTLYELGNLYEERLKNFVDAAEIYERIVLNHPGYLSIDKVYFHLASCYEKMGKKEEAARNYQIVVNDYGYSSYYAAAQAKMKELAVGTSYQDGAIETQSDIYMDAKAGEDEAQAALDLADMHAQAGNYEQAIDAYRKAANSAETQDTGIRAYQKMIDIMNSRQKDYEGAAKALEEMISTYPDAENVDQFMFRLGRIYEEDLETLNTRVVDGRVLYRKDPENVEKAINYYNELTRRFPYADVSADAFVRKGKLYDKELNNYEQARESYQEFLRRFPNHSQAESIRARLEEIEDW